MPEGKPRNIVPDSKQEGETPL